jgi:hypothetical protein
LGNERKLKNILAAIIEDIPEQNVPDPISAKEFGHIWDRFGI